MVGEEVGFAWPLVFGDERICVCCILKGRKYWSECSSSMMKEYGQTNESETEETGWSMGWQRRGMERKVKTWTRKAETFWNPTYYGF